MTRVEEAQEGAARWILAREEPGWTAVDQAELDDWLAESDLHRVAFIRLEHCWREADRISALRPAAMPSTLRDARPRRPWVTGWVSAAAAALLIAMVGVGWHQMPDWTNIETETVRYDTGTGGHKKIDLADGSMVELNTASIVRTAESRATREVWLDRGEAYFEVAHDYGRKFVVHAGNRQVTVLGTKFSVRRDGGNVNVMVREGRVRVDDIKDRHVVRSATISDGDIALTRGDATLVVANSDKQVEASLAWREGMLVFDQDALSEVVAEFNRYNRQQLVVVDPAAANIRIGGMFPSTKAGAFVHLLRDAYGLRIEETPDTIFISS